MAPSSRDPPLAGGVTVTRMAPADRAAVNVGTPGRLHDGQGLTQGLLLTNTPQKGHVARRLFCRLFLAFISHLLNAATA